MTGIKQKYQDLFFQTEQTVNRKKSGFPAAHSQLMSSSSRILSVLIGVEYQNICGTFVTWMWQIQSKLIYVFVTYKHTSKVRQKFGYSTPI